MAQNTCVCGYRPVLYYFKVNGSVLERFTKPGMAIMDTFLLQIHNLLQSKPTFFEESRHILLLFGPKTHVCMALDWYHTILTSILVHYQGS